MAALHSHRRERTSRTEADLHAAKDNAQGEGDGQGHADLTTQPKYRKKTNHKELELEKSTMGVE